MWFQQPDGRSGAKYRCASTMCHHCVTDPIHSTKHILTLSVVVNEVFADVFTSYSQSCRQTALQWPADCRGRDASSPGSSKHSSFVLVSQAASEIALEWRLSATLRSNAGPELTVGWEGIGVRDWSNRQAWIVKRAY